LIAIGLPLASVIVSTELWPRMIGVGANALVTVGAAAALTTSVAVAGAALGSALVDVTPPAGIVLP
jgi:hypothetical protein